MTVAERSKALNLKCAWSGFPTQHIEWVSLILQFCPAEMFVQWKQKKISDDAMIIEIDRRIHERTAPVCGESVQRP